MIKMKPLFRTMPQKRKLGIKINRSLKLRRRTWQSKKYTRWEKVLSDEDVILLREGKNSN